ncbi:MAG: DUF6351 family protein, partial [Oceanococcus sp.]
MSRAHQAIFLAATVTVGFTLSACGGKDSNPDRRQSGDATPTPQATTSPTSSASPNPGVTPTPGVSPSPNPSATPVDSALKVLSNRPDLISGNDVLVAVTLESAAEAANLLLTLNGDDVTSKLTATDDDPLRLIGLIDGLQLGENSLSLGSGDSVSIVNHPKGGPVFTGPQIQPWDCRNADAVDEQCNQDVAYRWLYKSSDSSVPELQAYDTESPPTDVANTTTDTGETVPFIVYEESGYQARDKYTIFTLQQPEQDWSAVNPPPQWNRRLLITHGGNCRGKHQTGSPQFDDYAGT